ncbi:50S ribosomal protein L29 [Candidatus Gracilibacteria bacterium]|nr:50S ribosomal protein L29 [Candidatus Gracilibacteria bacterium]
MKIQELRQLTQKKLNDKLATLRRALAVKRFHSKTGQDQKTSNIRELKKTIARILTILRNEKK